MDEGTGLRLDGRNIPVPQETLDLLRKITTSTLTGQLQEMGFRNTYMMGIQTLALPNGERMVGRARTLRFIPYREDLLELEYKYHSVSPHRSALEDINPNDVLVVDTGGSLESAVAGEMFTTRVKQRGGNALVVDGAVRDLSAILEVGLPVFARGRHGAGITRTLMSVGRDEPIRCGEVPVIPGDVIVGDEDGVVAIAPHIATGLAEQAFHHQAEEVWIKMKLGEGYSLHEVYPPKGEYARELEAWIAARKASP